MRIGLIDVDGHNFPNLPLMKLSAWHKQQGDSVEWYIPTQHGFPLPPMDKVYMSKVFSFTPDYWDFVNAKEGSKAYKVADLSEFWKGQKNIVLLDPNPVACREWKDILQQLIDSSACVDFSQGVDIRLMTEEKAEMIKRIKTKNIHFAWDRYEDKEKVIPKFKEFKRLTQWDKRKLTVYVLTNFDTTIEQDLDRIYTLRDMGYWPYVMIYDKEHTKSTDTVRRIQRWVNMRAIFESVKRFEDYKAT